MCMYIIYIYNEEHMEGNVEFLKGDVTSKSSHFMSFILDFIKRDPKFVQFLLKR